MSIEWKYVWAFVIAGFLLAIAEKFVFPMIFGLLPEGFDTDQ